MKHVICQGPKLRKSLVAFLMLQLALFLATPGSNAQGWGFSYTLVVNGPCAPYVSIANALSGTIPSSIPDKKTCESLRKILTDFHYSVQTTDGLCEEYFQCTPCTGSDLSSGTFESEFGMGNISVDGILQGTAFFSPHDSKELESWMNDYMTRLRSMGISVSDINTISIQNIPLTGDSYIDNYYLKQAMGFESYVGSAAFKDLIKKPESTGNETSGTPKTPKPEPAPAPAPPATEEGIGTTVQLLTSYEQQKKRDDWNEEHNLNNVSQVGSDNSIDNDGNGVAITILQDVGLEQTKGLISSSYAGLFSMGATDGSLSAIDESVQNISKSDIAGMSELGNSLLDGKVAINTANNLLVGSVKSSIQKAVLGKVEGASTVMSVISNTKKAVKLWNTINGKPNN
jgi:hypothetical protein